MKLLTQQSHQVSRILRVLANESRLRAVCYLGKGECCAGDLADKLQISYSSLSQHLSKMVNVGLVSMRREGNSSIYSLIDPKVLDVVAAVCPCPK